MTKHMGLWIDRGQAIIVALDGNNETIEKVESNVGARTRFSGASQAKVEAGSRDSWAEDTRDRRYEATVSKFYDAVIAQIKGADAVFIFGPGEAKSELHKRCQDKKAGVNVVKVESADKMTDRQIAAKVRDFFENT